MNSPIDCPHCKAKKAYWQTERGDSCDVCGYWDYYPDAYAGEKEYLQGYR